MRLYCSSIDQDIIVLSKVFISVFKEFMSDPENDMKSFVFCHEVNVCIVRSYRFTAGADNDCSHACEAHPKTKYIITIRVVYALSAYFRQSHTNQIILTCS